MPEVVSVGDYMRAGDGFIADKNLTQDLPDKLNKAIEGNKDILSNSLKEKIKSWVCQGDIPDNYSLKPTDIIIFHQSQKQLKRKYDIQNNPKLRKGKDFFCNKCYDTEEIVDFTEGLFRGRECSCVQKKQAIKQKREQQKRIEDIFSNSQISKQNLGKTFEDFTGLEGKKQAKKVAQGYANNFDQIYKQGLGLTIIGDTGVGKTMLAEILAQQVMKDNYTCLFTTAYDLWLKIATTYKDGSEISTDNMLKKPKNVDLLILDNFNAVSKKRFTSDEAKKFFNIINYRYNYNLPTILTTTSQLKELKNDLSKDLIERIKEKNKTLELGGVNFRDVKGQKADQIIDQIIEMNNYPNNN